MIHRESISLRLWKPSETCFCSIRMRNDEQPNRLVHFKGGWVEACSKWDFEEELGHCICLRSRFQSQSCSNIQENLPSHGNLKSERRVFPITYLKTSVFVQKTVHSSHKCLVSCLIHQGVLTHVIATREPFFFFFFLISAKKPLVMQHLQWFSENQPRVGDLRGTKLESLL